MYKILLQLHCCYICALSQYIFLNLNTSFQFTYEYFIVDSNKLYVLKAATDIHLYLF